MKPSYTTTLFNFHRGKNLRFGIHLSRAWTLGLTPCQLPSLSLKVANAQRGLHGEGPRALREGLFTALSFSHGCGARAGVFTKSTVPPSEGTFGQKSWRCKARGEHEKCRYFAFGKLSPLTASPSLHVLAHSPAPGKEERGCWC